MMERGSRYIGLNELVDELGVELSQAKPRHSYVNRERLVDDLTNGVRRFLEQRLAGAGLEFQLWRGVVEPGSQEGIQPGFLFGAEFVPDMVVEVSGSPTLALHVELIRRNARAHERLATAIGASLAYSQMYPAVLTVVHREQPDEGSAHFLDRELAMSLWHLHKIRLVVR